MIAWLVITAAITIVLVATGAYWWRGRGRRLATPDGAADPTHSTIEPCDTRSQTGTFSVHPGIVGLDPLDHEAPTKVRDPRSGDVLDD